MRWVDERADGHVITNFFASVVDHFFLPMVLRCARARAPLLRSPQEKLKTLWYTKFWGILGNFVWFSEILAFEATLKFE